MQWRKTLQKGHSDNTELKPCSGCGALLPGGDGGCQELFNQLLARDYTNPLFGSVHMLAVDCHSLQHPENHGYKSNSVHLLSLCWQLEHGDKSGPGVMPKWMRQEFDGRPAVPKLEPPKNRGQVTIVDVHGVTTPAEHGERVRRWAASVWEAWSAHQAWARQWLAEKMPQEESRRGR